jgi:hypothetical protein
VSLPSTASVYNHPPPIILQHEAVAVNNDISSTINVPSADPTIGVLTTTTTSSHLKGSSYAASLSAGLHGDVNLSYLSLDADVVSSQQFDDTSTMDLDVSCHHNSGDDEMPNEAGFLYFDESSVDGGVDHVETDDDFAPANKDRFIDTSDIQPDFSLMCKYNTYLSSGLGQMKASTAYQRDIEHLQILTKAKAPVYLFDQIIALYRTTVHISKLNLLDKSASLSHKAVLKQIYKRFDLHGSKPKEIEVTLPGSKETVRVVTHDFKEQLNSLLSDQLSCVMSTCSFPKTRRGSITLLLIPKLCIIQLVLMRLCTAMPQMVMRIRPPMTFTVL